MDYRATPRLDQDDWILDHFMAFTKTFVRRLRILVSYVNPIGDSYHCAAP